MFVVSPTAVKLRNSSEPMLPISASPELNPIRKQGDVGWSRDVTAPSDGGGCLVGSPPA
jgi:hypothetical protein